MNTRLILFLSFILSAVVSCFGQEIKYLKGFKLQEGDEIVYRVLDQGVGSERKITFKANPATPLKLASSNNQFEIGLFDQVDPAQFKLLTAMQDWSLKKAELEEQWQEAIRQYGECGWKLVSTGGREPRIETYSTYQVITYTVGGSKEEYQCPDEVEKAGNLWDLHEQMKPDNSNTNVCQYAHATFNGDKVVFGAKKNLDVNDPES